MDEFYGNPYLTLFKKINDKLSQRSLGGTIIRDIQGVFERHNEFKALGQLRGFRFYLC